MAQRPFTPTKDQRTTVEMMAGFGIHLHDICLVVVNPDTKKPITEKTLRKKFPRELETGAVKANAAVVTSLYKNATQGDTTAQIWWTKCRMGWKDTSRQDAPAATVTINL